MDILGWAIVALVVAVIAGALGFSGVAKGAATVSRILFGVALVIFLVLLVLAIVGGALIF